MSPGPPKGLQIFWKKNYASPPKSLLMITMKLQSPWKYRKDELRSALLFHGTCEPWLHPTPRGGGYDGVFWAAEDPLTAQTYIPEWGLMVLTGLDRWDLDKEVRPDRSCSFWEIAQELGADAIVYEYDIDRASCWKDTGKPVTYRQVAQRLEEMGYKVDDNEYRYRLKLFSRTEDGKTLRAILPKDRTPPGRLILVEKPDDLRVYDMAKGDPDLTDIEYHNIRGFKQAFEAGFDAVKINDFAQSPKMGNIGHSSIGLSPETAKRLFSEGRIVSIAATHRDFTWPMGSYPEAFSTPDFDQWHFIEVCRALARGDAVAPEVIEDHAQRFEELQTQQGDQPLVVAGGIDSLELADWPLEDCGEREVSKYFVAIECAEALDMPPVHRDANGKLVPESVDRNFAAALVKTGLAFSVPMTLDDGAGRPVLVEDFFERVCWQQTVEASFSFPR